MCLYPKLVNNPKYKANKKNKGIIPKAKDKRALYVPVGCGKCMECKKTKAREWAVRLQEEIRHDETGIFITLTFSNEELHKLENEIKGVTGYNLDNEVATLATRRFLERWRKTHKKSIKHWLVTEIGGKYSERIHLHGIIWTDKNTEEIRRHWKYGNVWGSDEQKNGVVNEKTINYIVKYFHKTDLKHKEYQSKILTSAGIGQGYFKREDWKKNKYKGDNTQEMYKTRQGVKLPMPIYYRNQIYSDEEREKLWLQKLDKKKRYVNGREIDISKGEEKYYKVLEEERLINKALNYGDNEINWERKRYENQRRNFIKLERLKKMNEKNSTGSPAGGAKKGETQHQANFYRKNSHFLKK